MQALNEMDPLDIKAYQYDIVCNGVELSSGAVRNHRPDIMVKAFEIAGYTEEDIKNKFPALYTAFTMAPAPCGYGSGIDRMVMLLTGQENIRSHSLPHECQCGGFAHGSTRSVSETQLREVI